MWGGTAIATCFIIFRLYARLKGFKKLFVDDYLVIVAWIFMLTVVCIWQTQLPALYTQYKWSGGTIVPTPDILATEQTLLRSEVPSVMFSYFSLWTIKLSFLFFFRRLSEGVQGQKAWWWFVFTITLATLATAIGVMEWGCSLGSLEYIFGKLQLALCVGDTDFIKSNVPPHLL